MDVSDSLVATRSSEQADSYFHAVVDPISTPWAVAFPKGAIEDEMVLYFTNRKEYQNYLKMLAQAGLSPLGQIDELMVVRIGKQAMVGPKPSIFGGESGFSYRVQLPLPPVDVAPELYAQLYAYGESARVII